MQYLIKEYDQGEEITFTMHLATDEGDETAKGSLWEWLRRAGRGKVSIAVYRVGQKILAVGNAGPLDRYLVVDKRGDEEVLSILWPREVAQFVHASNRGEHVSVYFTECVLDLS